VRYLTRLIGGRADVLDLSPSELRPAPEEPRVRYLQLHGASPDAMIQREEEDLERLTRRQTELDEEAVRIDQQRQNNALVIRATEMKLMLLRSGRQAPDPAGDALAEQSADAVQAELDRRVQ